MKKSRSVSLCTLLIVSGMGVSACGDRDARGAAEGLKLFQDAAAACEKPPAPN